MTQGPPEPPEERVARLLRAGAERFDPLGAGLVASLLRRAAALEGGAREKLRARAAARLDALEASLEAARRAAEAQLEALEAAGAPIDPELAAALAQGDFTEVERGVRRRLAARERARQRVALPWLTRLRREAQARGLQLPEEEALDRLAGNGEVVVARGAQREAQALGHAISAALFRESATRARAELAVARARDNAPAAAGPYNPQVLSARALAALAELSPGYVRAVIAELDDLAGLKAALDHVPRRARHGARKRRRRAAA